MAAELYEETLRFEEEALAATIEAYQDQQEPMSVGMDMDEECSCPVCMTSFLRGNSVGCECEQCGSVIHGATPAQVSGALVDAAAVHGNVCLKMDLRWIIAGGALHCKCVACGATATKSFA